MDYSSLTIKKDILLPSNVNLFLEEQSSQDCDDDCAERIKQSRENRTSL